jgi:hypothetical protein
MDLRRSLLLTVLALSLAETGRTQEPRIEQARQFELRGPALGTPATGTVPAATLPDDDRDEESFGVQQLLRESERMRSFRAFADVSAFLTNNVALTRRERRSDAFLLATLGFECRRALPRGLQFDTSLRVATFRYNEFNQLDFTSVDAGAGLSYHASKLGGLDFFARYNFNELFSAETDDEFFKNHTITLGAQKTVAFSQAHHAFFGASGQIGFADPEIAERSELSAFAGYRLQVTRDLEADLLYRYAYFFYSEGDRRDQNQTVSLGVRYRITDWFNAGASTYFGWNQSNQNVFDYHVANGGVGLTLSLQF